MSQSENRHIRRRHERDQRAALARAKRQAGVELARQTIGILMGVAETPDDVEECKRQTHDKLIHVMGTRRTGPVTWRFGTGDDAVAIVNGLAAEGEPLGAYRQQYLDTLAGWPEAVVVVASAPGSPGFDPDPDAKEESVGDNE